MESWSPVYHNLIDAMAKGVHVINRQGLLVDANRAWLIYYGVTLGDVRGRHIREIMQDMMYANSRAIDPDAPATEYTSPAALETLKTGLPSAAPFNNGRMVAVARPVYHPRGHFDYVVTTIMENIGGAPVKRGGAVRGQGPEPPPQPRPATPLVGTSRSMAELRATITKVAPSGVSVLITGETGTGKEIVASELHRQSGRPPDKFIRVNCAAIPESLIESELFGYERGAFTGALSSGKMGLIEAADGGTLFLDEINSLPLAQQSKLLRVLESKGVQRVGGLKEKKVNFRLVAATNADLLKLVEEKQFRADLLYRLNVVRLELPPLRHRSEDVIPIFDFYLKLFGRQYKRTVELDPGCAELLEGYHWPGNVRELRNMAEYLVVTAEEPVILPGHIAGRLSPPARPETDGLWHEETGDAPWPDSGEAWEEAEASATAPWSGTEEPPPLAGDCSLKEYLEACERHAIRAACARYKTSGEAAKALGIDRTSVVRKRKKYNI